MASWRSYLELELPADWESAEPAQEAGWLRSKHMGRVYPRDGILACGRRSCPVCTRSVSEAPTVAPWDEAQQPEPEWNAWAALL